MKKKSKIITCCVALLVLCIAVYFVLRPRDFYKVTYDSFIAVSGGDAELESLLAKNGLNDGDTNYAGVILKTEMFDLKKGGYTVTVRYSNSGFANSCELYSPYYVSMSNQAEKVYAKQNLDITQNGESAFSFSLDNPAEYLELRILYTGGDIYIDSIEVTRDGIYYTDAIFAALFTLIFGAAAIYLYIKDDKKESVEMGHFALSRLQAYLLCLLIAVIATLPLFGNSFVFTHDGLFHLERIDGIASGLAQGQFPVRINANYALGRGFAEPVMYPNLFLYIPGIIRLCGSSLMFAYIFVCFIVNLATSLIAYYCFKRLLRSDFMGFVCTVLYSFALYRIVDIYTRGALGELISMAFVPLVILGIYEVVCGDEKKYALLVAGMCGVLASHILSVVLCFLFCAVFVICNLKRVLKKQRLAAFGKSAGLSVLLNIWFLIPLFTYYGIGLRLFDTSNIAEHRVRVSQLFQTFVNAYGETEYLASSSPEMSLSVGGILAAGCLVYIGCIWKMRKDKNPETARLFRIGNYSLVFSGAALVVSSVLFPWDFIYNIPVIGRFLAMIQFPWRYLMIATVFMCIAAAIAVGYIVRNAKRKGIYAAASVALCLLALVPYFHDYYTSDLQTIQLETKFATLYDNAFPADYYFPETDTNMLVTTPDIRSPIVGINYDGYYKNGAYLHFVYSAPHVADGDYIDVPLYCYPGYTVVYNDIEILDATRGENGVIRIYLPEGATSGSIRVKYAGLWYFYVGDAVTALTLLAIASLSIVRRAKQNGKMRMNNTTKDKKMLTTNAI